MNRQAQRSPRGAEREGEELFVICDWLLGKKMKKPLLQRERGHLARIFKKRFTAKAALLRKETEDFKTQDGR